MRFGELLKSAVLSLVTFKAVKKSKNTASLTGQSIFIIEIVLANHKKLLLSFCTWPWKSCKITEKETLVLYYKRSTIP